MHYNLAVRFQEEIFSVSDAILDAQPGNILPADASADAHAAPPSTLEEVKPRMTLTGSVLDSGDIA